MSSRSELKEKKHNYINVIKLQACMDCKSLDYPITFDHARGEKVDNLCRLVSRSNVSFSKLVREAEKCDPVCRSCHDIREFRRGKYSLKVLKKNIFKLAELLKQELDKEEFYEHC